ncbi:MAG: VOC family protein [Propionibacteriaceae bacterium]|nr:VOC family protein [Propionibacteriaceae bacterium]
MHVDHLTFAVGANGLKAEADRLGKQLGARFRDGGFHPRFGTRNYILELADDRYIEVVEVLEHPVAEKAPYGQAVRARSEMGGGWMSWVISVPDLAPFEKRLDRAAVLGSRRFPDGRLLEWHQIGVKGLLSDPQLPYFLKWDSEPEVLPSALQGTIKLVGIEIGGERKRVEEWLGEKIGPTFDDVKIEFTSEYGQPGIHAVTFETKKGLVRV